MRWEKCKSSGWEVIVGGASVEKGVMTDYGYVSVHETKDAAQGEVLAELLRQEGIAARFRGAATTLVGLAMDVVAMAVEVPAADEARAREFLRDLEGTTGSIGGKPDEG
jgi:hypothetical protein